MSGAATYTNPVYTGYFADPYVLRAGSAYYAYGTGSVVDGRVFEVLRSDDLVRWARVGGALVPPHDPQERDHWAPEVVENEGLYYMYYSHGSGHELHRIHVAISESPEGPFEDAGRLVHDDESPFCIDPHAFRVEDGQWYLFYARDYLDGQRVGTALAVDRLVDMTTVEGAPHTVRRATGDWQLFQAQREIYGAVYDWYTLEGPCVRKRDGRYFCLYSGGSFQGETYGVSYAVADSPLGPYEEPHEGPVILKTVPGKVIGPGHNSLVEAPNGDEYIVYHAWDVDVTARRMCIDRLEWGPEGPTCSGPTWTPQPAPLRSTADG